ncbi:hypothetical protein NN3_41590 [Nocardia neocaledoniensis NBRC 108232]|uniref:type I-E CRISPR-associated protein Cse1/CasA n=1 Tax=Nocardia neocaledoniensis TaxID=236511 RepID=UPI001194521B|nr:type I-E CRISPR-associated protein Cse1/CasA [Nocardia neocaledoniensis]GEM33152.1 hypothetical protein NN3_41590 [Nocardia neocaledoniensis NBRC 108232]
MNLRTLPWIPVRRESESRVESLESLFREAHSIQDLAVCLVPAATGLWRILTVIAARITGLDNPDLGEHEWLSRRDAVLADGRFDGAAIGAYFDSYSSRFDLFDADRPWLQDPRLSRQCARTSGLNTLILGRPAGNNQSWLSHHRDSDPVPISAGDAALQLIAQLYHGTPGRCTARRVGAWTDATAKSAPLRGLVSYHPVGRSVFESLMVSVPYLPYDATRHGPDFAWWELPELPDPLMPPNPAYGVGGVLTGRFCHALLLIGSEDGERVIDGYRTWGVREPAWSADDPFLIYQLSKTGRRYPRYADADRALWRDVDGVLLDDVGYEHSSCPSVFARAKLLADTQLLDALRVRAFGFDQDRAQATDRQWYTSTTPAVFGMVADRQAAVAASRARMTAEMVARRLDRAVRSAWIAVNDPSNGGVESVPVASPKAGPVRRESDIAAGPWQAAAAARYWPAAEREFWRQIREGDLDQASRRFRALGLRAFGATTERAGRRPRARRAIERARASMFDIGGTPS